MKRVLVGHNRNAYTLLAKVDKDVFKYTSKWASMGMKFLVAMGGALVLVGMKILGGMDMGEGIPHRPSHFAIPA